MQTESGEEIVEFELVVDGSCVATAVWTQHNGTLYDVYANRASSGAWGVPELLDSEDPADLTEISLEERLGDLFFTW